MNTKLIIATALPFMSTNALRFDYSINANEVNTFNIPKDFQGFAVEWSRMEENFGVRPDSFSANPKLINILSHLKNGRIAVNGNTGSYAYLKDSTLTPLPEYETNEKKATAVTPEHFQLLNEVSEKTGMKLIIGAPMLSQDPAYAVDFIQNGIMKYVNPTHLLAVELGNEPDHFSMDKKLIRSPPYTFNDYMTEYDQILAGLNTVGLGNIPITGPAFAGCNTWAASWEQGHCWRDDFFTFAKNTPANVHSIGYHRYGQSGCNEKTTVESLMSDPNPEEDHYKWLDELVPNIKAIGKELVWSEGNAFSCGGKEEQSNAYGTAIWTLDTLFENAVRGVNGGLIHSSYNKDYAAFKVDQENGNIHVQSVFYAQWLFAQILTDVKSNDNDNVKAYRPTLNKETSEYNSKDLFVKSYVTENTNTGKINVVFFLKDPEQAGQTIDYVLSFGENVYNKPARVTRMNAESIYSQEGIYINGQTFTGTTDGNPSGERETETIYPDVNGFYNVQLKTFEVIVLSIEK